MAYRPARLKTRLTPYVNNKKEDEDLLKSTTEPKMEANSLSLHRVSTGSHSIFYSWFAGSLRGVGNGLFLQSTAPVDVVRKTVNNAMSNTRTSTSATSATLSTRGMMRMLLPGFFSFETHHLVSHSLFHHVKQEEPPLITTNTKISTLESFFNHQLHFVAGAAGGLSYGLAAGVIEGSFSGRMLRNNALSHGALFGGYDCFADLFGSLQVLPDHSGNGFLGKALTVGLSGGFAGMTQSYVQNIMNTLSLAPKMSFAMQHPRLQQSWTRLLRAFPPGAAAFLAYEYTKYSFQEENNDDHH